MMEMLRGIIFSHLECDLTEENGWQQEDVAFLEKMLTEDFEIVFKDGKNTSQKGVS